MHPIGSYETPTVRSLNDHKNNIELKSDFWWLIFGSGEESQYNWFILYDSRPQLEIVDVQFFFHSSDQVAIYLPWPRKPKLLLLQKKLKQIIIVLCSVL